MDVYEMDIETFTPKMVFKSEGPIPLEPFPETALSCVQQDHHARQFRYISLRYKK